MCVYSRHLTKHLLHAQGRFNSLFRFQWALWRRIHANAVTIMKEPQFLRMPSIDKNCLTKCTWVPPQTSNMKLIWSFIIHLRNLNWYFFLLPHGDIWWHQKDVWWCSTAPVCSCCTSISLPFATGVPFNLPCIFSASAGHNGDTIGWVGRAG